MARWAPRDGLGLEGQRDRHGDSARLPLNQTRRWATAVRRHRVSGEVFEVPLEARSEMDREASRHMS